MKNQIRIIAVALFASVFFWAFALPAKNIIVIDASHGGADTGVEVGKDTEKKIVRDVAKYIVAANSNPNVEIYVMGEEDVFTDLQEKTKAINTLHPDVVVSLHVNGSKNSSDRGVGAVIGAKTKFYDESKKLGTELLDALSGKILQNRNISAKNLTVISNVDCPAVALEIGFLTNASDNAYITSVSGQREIGEKIASVLMK